MLVLLVLFVRLFFQFCMIKLFLFVFIISWTCVHAIYMSASYTGRTSVDIGASANLAVEDKFCCLGDMLSVDGDADAVVEARIRIG